MSKELNQDSLKENSVKYLMGLEEPAVQEFYSKIISTQDLIKIVGKENAVSYVAHNWSFEDTKIDQKYLSPEDHIIVAGKIPFIGGIYKHHGIICEDNTVVHFGPEENRPVKISLEAFMGRNTTLYRRNYTITIPPGHSLQLIEHMLNKEYDSYKLFKNNCEGFASFIKFGKNVSFQIEKLKIYKNNNYVKQIHSIANAIVNRIGLEKR